MQFLDIGYGTSGPVIEIISPINKDSKSKQFFRKSGESVHHLAYYIEKIEDEIKRFQKNGMILISDIVLEQGTKKSRTIWLMGQNRELVELIEKNIKFKKID